jgi:hypothetical protein
LSCLPWFEIESERRILLHWKIRNSRAYLPHGVSDAPNSNGFANHSMRRLAVLLLAVGLLAAGGYFAYRHSRSRPSSPIAAQGGRPFSIRLPVVQPHFLQRDAQWSADRIGGSAESLGSVGCTICSVATAARSLGEPINPGELNRQLVSAGGYTSKGWLIWSAIAQAFGNRIEAAVFNQATHADIDYALERGEFPIVKFFLPLNIPHWAVVVGKQHLDYLIHDPLVNDASPIPLSSRTSSIQSVRIIRRR